MIKEILRSSRVEKPRFDLSVLKHDPLASQLTDYDLRIEPEVEVASATAGDVFAFYEEKPHLAVATGRVIGNRQILYRQFPQPELTAYLSHPASVRSVRIARQTKIPLPELTPTNPVQPASTEKYLAQLPNQTEIEQFRFLATESLVNIFHRSTGVRRITSPDEIQFNARTGELPAEYLLVTKQGIPIWLSDYHQKLATHLGYLVATELLPNVRPVISWIDEHPDDVTTRNGLTSFPKKQFLLKGVNTLVDKIDCGQAASFLMQTQLADIRYLEGLSGLGTPPSVFSYPAFSHQHPLARPSHDQPHVVSFDLDQLPNFCDREYNKYVGGYVGLDATTTNSYFSWLTSAGLNSENVDAVCAYTSPGFVEPEVAIEGFKYLVSHFE